MIIFPFYSAYYLFFLFFCILTIQLSLSDSTRHAVMILTAALKRDSDDMEVSDQEDIFLRECLCKTLSSLLKVRNGKGR